MLCVQGRVLTKYAVHRNPRRTFLKTVLAEGISHFKTTEQFLTQLLLHVYICIYMTIFLKLFKGFVFGHEIP